MNDVTPSAVSRVPWSESSHELRGPDRKPSASFTAQTLTYTSNMGHVLTQYAAARLLDVGIEEVEQLQADGALPVYNLGGERFVPGEALFAYAERNEIVLAPYFPLSL